MEGSFEARVESGSISVDDIYTYYCEAIVRDRLRIEAYLQLGLEEWAAFTIARRQILIADMKENEWEISDVEVVDVKETLSKLTNNSMKRQALAAIKPKMAVSKPSSSPRQRV